MFFWRKSKNKLRDAISRVSILEAKTACIDEMSTESINALEATCYKLKKMHSALKVNYKDVVNNNKRLVKENIVQVGTIANLFEVKSEALDLRIKELEDKLHGALAWINKEIEDKEQAKKQ